MSLADSQRLLAHLYTDATLRKRFFAAPEDVGQEWGLEAAEARALAPLRQQVAGFARTLTGKRLRGVRGLMPLTAQLLGERQVGERLDDLFSAYAQTERGRRPPEGFRKIPRDALRFAAFVDHQNTDELVRAVARFEATWVRAHAPGFRFAAAFFPYRMGEIVRRLEGGKEIDRVRRPSLHMWWRAGRPRHLSIPG